MKIAQRYKSVQVAVQVMETVKKGDAHVSQDGQVKIAQRYKSVPVIAQITVPASMESAFVPNTEPNRIVQPPKHQNHVLTTMIAQTMGNA